MTLNPLGFSPLWFEPSSGHMWESQVLLTDGQVVFLRVLRFSPTFDERSARYKWNILERAVKPKSKKKKKKRLAYSQLGNQARDSLTKFFVWQINLLPLSGLIQQMAHWWYFSYFSQKTGFAISCKLSPLETICMKCQILFSREKKRKNISKCCLLKILPRVPNVNPGKYWPIFWHLIVISLWNFVLHSGVQAYNRLYGENHRKK